MDKKTTYSAPEADLLKLRFEENFMGSIDPDNNTETLTGDEDEVI